MVEPHIIDKRKGRKNLMKKNPGQHPTRKSNRSKPRAHTVYLIVSTYLRGFSFPLIKNPQNSPLLLNKLLSLFTFQNKPHRRLRLRRRRPPLFPPHSSLSSPPLLNSFLQLFQNTLFSVFLTLILFLNLN